MEMAAMAGTKSWAQMTQEGLVEVFRRLPFEDRYRTVPLVCKAWLLASRDPCCWEQLDMSVCFEQRQQSTEWWQPAFDAKMTSMLQLVVDRSRGRLCRLNTSHCCDAALSYLVPRCPGLRRLGMKTSPGVTDTGAGLIATICTQLEELDISECPCITVSSLQLFGQHCQALRMLKRNRLDAAADWRFRSMLPGALAQVIALQSGDEEARTLASFMPHLTHLELRNSSLSDAGLALIVRCCVQLQHLDLVGCPNLTREGLADAARSLTDLRVFCKPVLSGSNAPRYGHWQLYNERFAYENLNF